MWNCGLKGFLAPMAIATFSLSGVTGIANAQQSGSVERGKAFVETHCAACHAIGLEGSSPYAPAPPFRILHERYDVGNLAEAFAEGIIVAHNGPRQMPQFMLDPEQIDDLIAYLRSLETRS